MPPPPTRPAGVSRPSTRRASSHGAPLPFPPLVPIVPLLALVLALLLCPAAGAAAQPGLDSLVPPSPVPVGFIHDGGPVLDDDARRRLNERIAAVQRTTGGDIAVAILRDLRDRAPAEVGVAIYRAWGVGRIDSLGSARRDLGALLLIVPRELAPSGRGECWVTTGLGAEERLLDADAGTICRREIIPHLRAQRYEAAVGAGIDAVAGSFRKTTAGLDAPAAVGAVAQQQERDDGPGAGAWILGGGAAVGGLLGGVAMLIRRRRRRPRPCPHGHGLMARLGEAEDDAALDPGQRTEERVGSVDYDVWACASCDERLVIPYRRWRSSHAGCPKCGYRTVRSETRTVRAATTTSGGLDEVTLDCAHCGWRDVTRRSTPRLQPPVATSGGSGSFGGGSSGGGSSSSFGGSGSTSGGGGGSSY